MKLKNIETYSVLKGVAYAKGACLRKVQRWRQSRFLMKLSINGEFQGYVALDGTHRNLNINTEDENLELKLDY